MFSGIVEVASPVLGWAPQSHIVELQVQRPSEFEDLCVGDSVAVNGVCLTINRLRDKSIEFVLGKETLTVTGWVHEPMPVGKLVNLERSLRFGDRMHGHLVSGHVDGVGRVMDIKDYEGGRQLTISCPAELAPYLWSKGSLAVNGVSLTLNKVSASQFEVGLIPETLRRTNLGRLQLNDPVNLESDTMARGLITYLRSQELERDAQLG